MVTIVLVGERAKRARHSHVCSIENRGYIIYIYIQVKKKAFKINAKIEDVELNEDLKSTETRNGH